MPTQRKAGDISRLFDNNRQWVQSVRENDPKYFTRWAESQAPEFLWIGCADSRVVAEHALGLQAGQVFVHRNVGNVLNHNDNNAMSALEYSIKVLGVKDVLVAGHTNCGAIKAALTMPPTSGMITNAWISQIREVRNVHAHDLEGLGFEEQCSRLSLLNVAKQVFNVCTSPVVQQAWAEGSEVWVHGLLYDVRNGAIHEVLPAIGRNEQVPDTYHDAALSKTEFQSVAQALQRLGLRNGGGKGGLAGAGEGAEANARVAVSLLREEATYPSPLIADMEGMGKAQSAARGAAACGANGEAGNGEEPAGHDDDIMSNASLQDPAVAQAAFWAMTQTQAESKKRDE